MKTQRILDEEELDDLSEMWNSVSDFMPVRNHTWALIYRLTSNGEYEVVEFFIDFEKTLKNEEPEYLTPERKHGVFATKEFAQFYINSVYMIQHIVAPDSDVE
ncbi:hypothetical protein [Paenibacillus tianjinensis]|uniref:Uncharacterized protein n=1 Tax=Paenibacillus tianjinensis TaxID=2810347 RepID=A0ABX7L8Q5_9BACL|nr:hypothetical protein [Paenibacillus tianjinensis]QSF43414.1 hypothetical protein JRJ22_19310 [Paenibacillus tianjinensis]